MTEGARPSSFQISDSPPAGPGGGLASHRSRQNHGRKESKRPAATADAPSPQLAAVVGAGQVTRGDVVSKIWAYIKKNNLQNPANKREILADAKLKPVFDGKDKRQHVRNEQANSPSI